ncbi:lysine-rich arabinogalactan protein 19-like [Ochotona curzoniae]|uniref:lysine-rich arabinogalactan protein 19-like n=1 Tax=Ochotona curzoniae TaxID=130825 RepID=UPI001B345ECC|nr:lysine-rich arabinogalactan protein 19-like [Ochotona curzoniae]
MAAPERPSCILYRALWKSCIARILFVSFVCFVIVCSLLSLNMGQAESSPLSLTLQHWPDVSTSAHTLSVEVRRKKWKTLCTVEWPTLAVSWPPSGTFNLTTILQVKGLIRATGPSGHPDQLPYILVWEDLVVNPPPWAQPFLIAPCPPPPPSPELPAPSAPPQPQPSALVSLCPLEATRPRPKPVLPDDSQMDLLMTSELPPPYPQEHQPEGEPPRERPGEMGSPDTTVNEQPEARSPIHTRLRLRRAQLEEGERGEGQWSSQLYPLRIVGGQVQYWPFSASDLYNWKTHNPPFSQDPQALTGLIESILLTHQPTWDDCQQLLRTLLTTEEVQRVLMEARKNVLRADGQPTQLPNEIDEVFPLV